MSTNFCEQIFLRNNNCGYKVADLYDNNDDRLNVDGNNIGNDDSNFATGIALFPRRNMQDNLYYKIYTWENIVFAWRKARKHKTKKPYILKFEENLIENLQQIQFELMTETYFPLPLKTFPLRDPKTRKISKADFRDRIVHHALCNVISSIFEKSFIYDSCANQKGKGNLFAIKRFDKFKRQVTNNLNSEAFCLKADIKHYFKEVNLQILMTLLRRKISCKKTLTLIEKILENGGSNGIGMPLGNLTSQFFANIYLHELDFFVKNQLKAKFYLRYVDDFIILHKNKEQLEIWRKELEDFLRNKLTLRLHPQKTKVFSLSQGVDFVGFRNFYNRRLIRKRSFKIMELKYLSYLKDEISLEKLEIMFEGWLAYKKHERNYTPNIPLNAGFISTACC